MKSERSYSQNIIHNLFQNDNMLRYPKTLTYTSVIVRNSDYLWEVYSHVEIRITLLGTAMVMD